MGIEIWPCEEGICDRGLPRAVHRADDVICWWEAVAQKALQDTDISDFRRAHNRPSYLYIALFAGVILDSRVWQEGKNLSRWHIFIIWVRGRHQRWAYAIGHSATGLGDSGSAT